MGLSRRTIAFILLLVLACAIGIDNLGRPLANPDEGRYSEISREMAHSGDWITPRLNDLKYFEKPPLQYWGTAAAFSVFGEGNRTARFYTALCGALAILAVALTLRRLASADRAMLGVGVLFSSPYFMAMGGIVTLDTGLTAWLTVAVCAFLVAHAGGGGERERRRWMLVAWAAIALAVLSKGLVGIVFPAAAIFLYCLVQRDWGLLRRLEWLRGVPLCLLIAAPWFLAVSARNPEFAHFFFVHEHFERFLTNEHQRVEPWWYFFPILFSGFLPWMVALVPACIEGWRVERDASGFRWRRFALLWSAFILLFFSASGSKLPGYILPVFPMLALVLADWLDRATPRRIGLYLLPVIPLIVAALAYGWGAPDRVRGEWTRDLYLAARPFIIGGGVVLVAGLGTAAALLVRGRKFAPLAVAMAASMIFVDGIEDGYEALSPRQSAEGMAQVIAPWLTPETRVYAVLHYDQSLPFYLRRPITLVGYRDEFYLGERAEPDKALYDVDVFVEEWLRPGNAIAIMQPGLYEDVLYPAGIPMIPIVSDERRMVVRKP